MDSRTVYEDAPAYARSQVNFINRVYSWMAAGLGLSALAAWMVAGYLEALSPEQFAGLRTVFLVLLVAELLLVFGISAAINRIGSFTAGVLFIVYSIMSGVTLAPIVLLYTQASLAATFVATGLTFGGMSLFGYVTKRDLTGVGAMCGMALWGLIVASIVNLFWANDTLYWIVTYAGILIFVGLTAYDTQKIKQMAAAVHSGMVDGETARKGAIMGALALYLDFINLFLLLLRLFGRRR